VSLTSLEIIHVADGDREGTTGRTLTTGMGVTGGGAAMTVALCTSACQAANFIYAGVEYAGECCKSAVFKSRLL
jgi:hypothetical protein